MSRVACVCHLSVQHNWIGCILSKWEHELQLKTWINYRERRNPARGLRPDFSTGSFRDCPFPCPSILTDASSFGMDFGISTLLAISCSPFTADSLELRRCSPCRKFQYLHPSQVNFSLLRKTELYLPRRWRSLLTRTSQAPGASLSKSINESAASAAARSAGPSDCSAAVYNIATPWN